MSDRQPGRDYSKFLTEDGLLNPLLLPRKVYVAMVFDQRDATDALVHAFDEVMLSFDLEQYRANHARRSGEELEPAEAARLMFDTLDDHTWWEAMEALERLVQRRFGENPIAWSSYVDDVYDKQERDGWRKLS